MSYDISDVNVLFPAKIDWQEFEKYQPWEPFADEVLEFLSVMSASLLPDMISILTFSTRQDLFSAPTAPALSFRGTK